MTGAEGLPLAVASGVVSYNEQDPETQGGERIASLPDIIVSILLECFPVMLRVSARDVPARQQIVFTPTGLCSGSGMCSRYVDAMCPRRSAQRVPRSENRWRDPKVLERPNALRWLAVRTWRREWSEPDLESTEIFTSCTENGIVTRWSLYGTQYVLHIYTYCTYCRSSERHAAGPSFSWRAERVPHAQGSIGLMPLMPAQRLDVMGRRPL